MNLLRDPQKINKGSLYKKTISKKKNIKINHIHMRKKRQGDIFKKKGI